MKKLLTITLLTSAFYLTSCDLYDDHHPPAEELTQFIQIGSLNLVGGATAAEISAYDPKTKRLFVVNAVKSAIDVVNMEDPFNLVPSGEISILPYGAGVNSVDVKNGLLAAAVESNPKTSPGKVVVFNTSDLTKIAEITVGALPDMVAFSDDGKFIVSANEGEPNEDYTVDPNGSISIIRVPGFSATTLDFTSFNSQANALKQQGFRMPGPLGTTLAQDTEPEYVAISKDCRTAWVTLQENNAVAKIDLQTKKIDKLMMLGFKNHNDPVNALDPSDRNTGITFGTFPVKGMYLPDGISAYHALGIPFFITANEGDSRLRPTMPPALEGTIFNEEARVKDIVLDPLAFPNAATLRTDAELGRLKITKTLGDTDNDGDYDELYSFGARSFTIRNGFTGHIVYDAGSELEKFLIQEKPGRYDDSRSDDKGVEPESVTVGKIGPRSIAFVGLERADAVVIVDVTNPFSPLYIGVLETGDAPEGVLFIPAHESPINKPLLVTSCEGDGTVQVFTLSGEEDLF